MAVSGTAVPKDPASHAVVGRSLRRRDLPGKLSDGMGFFRAALEKKVIVVPGEFFDVNPGKRRSARASRFRQYVRFSFGPERAKLETALQRIEELVADHM